MDEHWAVIKKARANLGRDDISDEIEGPVSENAAVKDLLI